MATTSRRSSGPVLPISSAFQRSISPSGRFPSANGCGVAASSTIFDHRRPSSPTRVNIVGVSPSPVPSVRFSLDSHRHRPTSPGRSLAVGDHLSHRTIASPAPHRRTCMCSPTTHPGSFRCSLHKGLQLHHNHSAISSPSNRLNARRSAMANSLVRIGTVEGEWVKRALTALIRPSSHQQRRRVAFQQRPSRLSVMSKADDL